MPRELVRSPQHSRKRSLGWSALWFIETFTVHGPGDVQGEPVEMDDEFAGFILDAYALDANGRRLYDSAFLSRPKGRAKSELAGQVTLFEAFGRPRFERWAEGGETWTFLGETYTYEAGEPIGRQVIYPFIRCLATEESQAGNTYDNVHFNLTDGPLSEDLPRDAAGLTRVILPGGGEIVPSTASSASKDGGKETFSTFDETHLYVLPELRTMYATVRRNLAKRRAAEPWSFETSTMYQAGQDSIAERTHKLAEAIASGKTRSSRLLFDHREAPSTVDLADEKSLRAALSDVYGSFAKVMDLRRIIDEIWDPRNSPADSRRYFLNQRTSAQDAWLTHQDITRISSPNTVLVPGEMIGLGFDGSKGASRDVADSTVLVATSIRTGHQVVLGAWEQPHDVDPKSWEPAEHEVEAVLLDAHLRYAVVGFFGDPSGWAEPMARWSAKWGPDYKVKRTDNQPIRWKTNQHLAWAEALKTYHEAITTQKVSFDGSPVFTAHLGNARRRVTRSGMTIAKEHPDSPNKIDAAVAGTYSYAVYLAAIAAGVLVDEKPFEMPFRIR